MRAAYAGMAGVSNSWTQSDAGVTEHPIPVFTLAGQTNISLAFMRLPDGDVNGSGFASDNYQSLEKLWTGSIQTMIAVDGSSSYTLSTLTGTLVALMSSFQPSQVNTMDYLGTYGDGDHSDHHTVGYLTKSAVAQYNSSTTFTGYEGYPITNLPANLSDADQTAKQTTFFTYAPYDSQVCGSLGACASTPYDGWLARQYTVFQARPPVAGPVAGQAVLPGATVTLDGSGSDPLHNAVSYQWTQTSGAAVTLSSATAVQPTFTAPSATGTLTFQLVVTDNQTQVGSTPAMVPVFVCTDTTDIALSATAIASSAASGQGANSAIDGVVGGYPGNASAEWATNGGGAGSWLQLTWSTAQTFDTIVLYAAGPT